MIATTASRRLTEILGIRHPILMAGMAGGITTPELVAAVSGGGGLGVFGANGMTCETLAEQVARASAAGGPVGVNVLLAPPAPEAPPDSPMHALLAGLRAELGLPAPAPRPAPGRPLDLLQAGLDAGARVVSVALGDPGPAVAMAGGRGVPVIAMATNVRDALAAEAAGVAAVVAQGAEAGGHRSEIPAADQEISLVGTMALVPQMVRAVKIPVIAAGGIMGGGGLVAAMALGAAGAQLGTRFLGAAESGAAAPWKARLAAARDTDTVVTAAVSGRPARAIRNRLVDLLSDPAAPPNLGWLRQGAAQADIVAAAGRVGRDDLQFLLAGQAAGLAEVGQPAGEILAQIVAEAASAFAAFAPAPGS